MNGFVFYFQFRVSFFFKKKSTDGVVCFKLFLFLFLIFFCTYL